MILFWVFAGFPLPILIAEQDAGVDIQNFIRVVVHRDKIEFFALFGELHRIFQAGSRILHIACDIGLSAGKGKDVIKMMMSGLSTPRQLPDFQLTEYILANAEPSRIYCTDGADTIIDNAPKFYKKERRHHSRKNIKNHSLAEKHRKFKIDRPYDQHSQRDQKQ